MKLLMALMLSTITFLLLGSCASHTKIPRCQGVETPINAGQAGNGR